MAGVALPLRVSRSFLEPAAPNSHHFYSNEALRSWRARPSAERYYRCVLYAVFPRAARKNRIHKMAQYHADAGSITNKAYIARAVAYVATRTRDTLYTRQKSPCCGDRVPRGMITK